MFQKFEVKGGPAFGRQNVPALREELARRNLDGFIVPHEDEYQNEYLPAANDRLAWLTGFTGSAGAAVILTQSAVMFADGRYTLQVREQTDPELFGYEDLANNGIATWLRRKAPEGAKLGYDPRLHSPDGLKTLEKAAGHRNIELIPQDTNPLDTVWEDRPGQPAETITVQPLGKAGVDHAEKRESIGEGIADEGADAAVLTAPPSIAWLLNIRGGDVAHSPLPLATVIIRKDGETDLFVNPAKVTDEVRSHLGNQVSIHEESAFETTLSTLKGKKVLVDPATASAWHFTALENAGAAVVRGDDPVALPKACKNKAEIEGSKAAHRRDGAAVTRFLHWFAHEAPKGQLDEITCAQKLEEIRRENAEGLKDISFETISGFGEHGALPHYRVNEASNLKIEKGTLYLVDSGGQYPDGTTDITRTMPVGEPTDEMRNRFTRVLKGHIALSVIRFPEGTSGMALDALARAPIWEAGLDYDHGTGHGVGAYLGVHEGPQRIAKGSSPVPLKAGMIVSNEPGYYKAGEFGIRIENLQYVTEPETIPGGDRPMLGFETLTLAPIDRNLIEPALLSDDERAWLNAYHARVAAEIGPLLDGEVRSWLEEVCAPV